MTLRNGGLFHEKKFWGKNFFIATYDEAGNPDAMNATWGGICDYKKIAVCLSPEHKTVKNILAKKAFTVSMADEKHVIESDYVGMVSANTVPDKLERVGFHTIKSENVDAPIIEELPLILECKLESYDEETDIMIAEIINVSDDESILMDGKIAPAKLSPITLDPVNSAYLKLGEKVGNAFKDGTRLK